MVAKRKGSFDRKFSVPVLMINTNNKDHLSDDTTHSALGMRTTNYEVTRLGVLAQPDVVRTVGPTGCGSLVPSHLIPQKLGT